ncbi:MAG: SDR family oxidoreductase [Solirubrobacterales bacterium]|nr:SDR family oxidoreductase [Solirubrobacterales bacterium]HMT05523.1 SDR family oxidoreductase [Solirubrobacterales bacterium]
MGENVRSEIFRDGLLDGRVVVLSGAGTGLGREAALEMVRLGAKVIGCGRRQEPLEETATLAEGKRGSFSFSTLDIRDEEAVDSFIERVVADHDRIDVLVNNAGGQFLSPAEMISPKGFRTVLELNVTGTWLMTHAAATRAFIPQESGAIINVTLSPHNGMPGMVHSGAARAAVENMTRTLSIEWSRFNIRTCSIAAGQFATDTFVNKYPKEIVESVHQTIPMGRVGESEEMGWLIAYLSSAAGAFHSGSVITLDGARDNWFGPWPPAAITGEGGSVPAEARKK